MIPTASPMPTMQLKIQSHEYRERNIIQRSVQGWAKEMGVGDHVDLLQP